MVMGAGSAGAILHLATIIVAAQIAYLGLDRIADTAVTITSGERKDEITHRLHLERSINGARLAAVVSYLWPLMWLIVTTSSDELRNSSLPESCTVFTNPNHIDELFQPLREKATLARCHRRHSLAV
jgi:hypothetical protein